MRIRTKKIIAKEILILFSIAGTLLLSWAIIYSLDYLRKEQRYNSIEQRDTMIIERDSLEALIRKPPPPSPEEYFSDWSPPENATALQPPDDADSVEGSGYVVDSLEVANIKSKLEKLRFEIAELNEQVSSITGVNRKSEIVSAIAIVLIVIVYVLRPLFYLIRWSFQVIREP